MGKGSAMKHYNASYNSLTLAPTMHWIPLVIGESVSKPHTSESKNDFSSNIIINFCRTLFHIFLTLQFNAKQHGPHADCK